VIVTQHNVYITSVGAFLPNPPVDNDRMEQVLGLVGGEPSRLKDRILRQNGICQRHYALDANGQSTHMNEELAAHAVIDALERRRLPIEQLEMLACGTTQGDAPLPGFASMVHGRLGCLRPAAQAMEVLSTAGVCCSGMAAFLSGYRAIQSGHHRNAAVCGSELVSKNLKAAKFEAEATLEDHAEVGYRAFDANFLRFMLSDGAGAVVLEDRPAPTGLSLRIEWIELISHAHERPVCMYTGILDKDHPRAGNTWLDFPTIADADRTGMLRIRQDTKLVPEVIKLGVEEYLRLVRNERIRTDEIDHLLCHYSSHFLKGEILKLLDYSGVLIPEEKWFTNLYTRGNTGAASIFIMLEEAVRTGRFQKGDTVLLMVPESGRFTVSFAKLVVVDATDDGSRRPVPNGAVAEYRFRALPARSRASIDVDEAIAGSPVPEIAQSTDALQRFLGVELALVWADFERMLRAVPIVQRLESGQATIDDYRRLLVNLRQQVMEGARWIARAASNVSVELFPLRSMFIGHAGEEHKDYQMLERDFVAVGGSLEEILNQPKNIGSEALSAFMFYQASQPDPLDLIGAMFVIEGLGLKKAGHWAGLLREQLGLTRQQTSFLTYHGQNDDDHVEKLRAVVASGILDEKVAKRMVKTAKTVARLYALQLEELDHV
jgi:3-oxoacyl-[acyl-carrier-protein] synthase-3